MKRASTRALATAFLVLAPCVVSADATSTSPCVQIAAHLSEGSTDAGSAGAVSTLQQFLTQTNASSTGIVTGYFGAKTVQALRQFQTLKGLQPTGILNASTSAAIEAACLANASATFSAIDLLSLSAAPSLSGSAQGFASPLMLRITPAAGGQAVYENDNVPLLNGAWAATAPLLPIGQYNVTLSTQQILMATSSLEVGIPSVPSVLPDQGSLPLSDVADGRLMRFAIHAGAQSNVTIGQLTFMVATDSADVSSVNLYAFTDPSFSIAASTSAQGNVINAQPLDPGSGTFKVVPSTLVTIPSGKTYFFELDATVAPSDTLYWVTTKLLGDSLVPRADIFSNVQSGGTNFIWSPDTFGPAATSDPDWINGSAVAGLGAELQVTRTNAPIPPPPPDIEPTVVESSSSSSTTSSATSSAATSTTSTSGTATSTATTTATTTPAASFTATPISGRPTLKVTFTGSVNASNSCSASTYTMAYGDTGSTVIAVPTKLCKPQSFSLSHLYPKNGSYVATLSLTTATSSKLIQSQIITVSATATASMARSNLAAVISAIPLDLYHLFVRLLGFIQNSFN